MKKYLSLLAICIFATSVANAGEHHNFKEACGNDMQTYCKDTNKKGKMKCLENNMNKLSSDCQTAMHNKIKQMDIKNAAHLKEHKKYMYQTDNGEWVVVEEYILENPDGTTEEVSWWNFWD